MEKDCAIRLDRLGKQYRTDKLTSAARVLGRPTTLFQREFDKEGRFWAFRDISLEIQRGEILGIVGPNGAGKSTLLKVLSRITEPTEGRAEICGRIGSLLEVGTGFHPELSGRDNIYLNGALLGMRRREIAARFDEIVAFAEVDRFIDMPVKHFSSGMYMRLAFAVAAHLEAEILIVDEVLAVGDIAFQHKCLGKMKNVSSGGRTVLFVSHNMSAIQSLCSRAVFIQNGSLVRDGDPRDVVRHYVSALDCSTDSSGLLTAQRQGTGEYRFRKVWMTDSSGAVVSKIGSGEMMRLHAEVEQCVPDLSLRCVSAVVLFNSDGLRIATLRAQDRLMIHELSGPAIFTWTISRLPLFPGIYRCDLFLGRWGGSEPFDNVFQAFQFVVLPGDFYRVGSAVKREPDVLLIDFDLEITRNGA